MKKLFAFFAIASLLGIYTADAQQNIKNKDYTKYVNPFIGTGSVDSLSLSGSNFPGAVVPFGFVQLSPDTNSNPDDPCSGYDYADNTIVGFSHTHLSGTGVADLFDFLFMPFKGKTLWNPEEKSKTKKGYSSTFSHDNETASPGYYSVLLDDPNVKVELTATEHVGVHKYTSVDNEPFSVMIDLNHSLNKKRPYWSCKVLDAQVRVINDQTIEGYRSITGWASERKVYFRAEFSRPFSSTEMNVGNKIMKNQKIGNHQNLKMIANFDDNGDIPVVIRVGVSSVSYEGAKNNLKSQVTDFDFDGVRNQAKAKWNNELSAIDVETNENNKTVFYTSLYHTYIHPNNIADANGDYVSGDGSVKNAPDKRYYSTFSLWDTFRAQHPLMTLVQEDRSAEFINSMIAHYQDYGYLPIWQLWGKETYCMIGNHAIPVIVDAFNKGISGVDYELAYEAIKASSVTPHRGSSFSVLDKYGYIPENIESQSVSITLEVAYNDWCVAEMAKALGHTADYEFFSKRSESYKNLYDSSIGFFRAKDDKGNWIEPFSPLKYGGNGGYPFTEGNAWQYLWYVPQDVNAFKDLMGGDKKFTNKLDEFFTTNAKPSDVNGNASGFIGQYAHGNEPSHHIAYLYNYTNQPWKSQSYTAKILKDLYLNSPSGYSGNEDAGQMSAWYVFSSLGFYPVNPANGIYSFGSPLVENATINLNNGKQFKVIVKNNSEENVYIRKIVLNGKRYKKNFITHKDIQEGGIITFYMDKYPNKSMANYEKPFSGNAVKIAQKEYHLKVEDNEGLLDSDVAKRFKETFYKAYPKMVAKYNTNSPKNVTLIVDGSYTGVAYADKGRITVSAAWMKKKSTDTDLLVHELMHVVQHYKHYTAKVPGWLTEGIADYVRHEFGVNNKAAGWALSGYKAGQKYTDSYRTTGSFILWVTLKYDKDFVIKMDKNLRDGTYNEELWKTFTGLSLSDLWLAYSKS